MASNKHLVNLGAKLDRALAFSKPQEEEDNSLRNAAIGAGAVGAGYAGLSYLRGAKRQSILPAANQGGIVDKIRLGHQMNKSSVAGAAAKVQGAVNAGASAVQNWSKQAPAAIASAAAPAAKVAGTALDVVKKKLALKAVTPAV